MITYFSKPSKERKHPIDQGWECPKCLTIWSPIQPKCWKCSPTQVSPRFSSNVTITTSGIPDVPDLQDLPEKEEE